MAWSVSDRKGVVHTIPINRDPAFRFEFQIESDIINTGLRSLSNYRIQRNAKSSCLERRSQEINGGRCLLYKKHV